MFQSHGAVVVIDPTRRTVLQASANTGALLGRDPGALVGRRLEVALGLEADAAVGSAAGPAVEAIDRHGAPAADATTADAGPTAFHWVLGAGPAARHLYVTRERHQDREVLVLMPERPSPDAALEQAALLHDLPDRLDRAPSTAAAAAITAMITVALSGHERALVLRFDAEGDAEVIADATRGPRDAAAAWTGLHIAANDLPWRTEELAVGRVHVVPDVDDAGVALVGLDGRSDATCALPVAGIAPLATPTADQAARLRGIGARSTLACSMRGAYGAVWALVTVHPRPQGLAPSALPAIRSVASAFAERAGRIAQAHAAAAGAAGADIGARLAEAIVAARDDRDARGNERESEALLALVPALHEAFDVDGVAIVTRTVRHASGCLALASAFAPALAVRAPQGILVTTDLVHAFPRGALGDAGGIVAVELDGLGHEWLVLGRSARPRTRRWLRPARAAVQGEAAGAPRVQFETRAAACAPLAPWLADGALRLRGAFLAVLAQAERERADRFAQVAEAARRGQERHWGHLQQVDARSGLLLPESFEQAADAALCDARSRSGRVALVVARLDNVDELMETFGFDAEDEAIAALAARCRAALAPATVTGRLGSERLALAVPIEVGPAALESLMATLRTAAARVDDLGGRPAIITATMGVAVGDGANDVASLLRAATAGLALARPAGPGSVALAPAQHTTPEGSALEHVLRTALDQHTLGLAYQPIVSAADGALVAMEALVRLHDPALGPIPAARVVPISHRSGLLPRLTDYVLANGLRERKGWEREWEAPVALAVNIAPGELLLPDFARRVLDQLDAHATPTSRLRVEITDSGPLRRSANAQVALATLQAAGVRIALDDFARDDAHGAADLLRALRPDAIKLDPTLVQNAPRGTAQREVALAIVRLAAATDVLVVAEGIETPEQLAFVRNAGCHEAQGYLVGRPLPPAGAAGYVRTLRSFAPSAAQGVAITAPRQPV